MKKQWIALPISIAVVAMLSVVLAPLALIAEGDRPVADSTVPSGHRWSIDDLLRSAGVEPDTTGPFAPYGMSVVMKPRWDSTPGPVDLVLTVVNLVDDGCTDFQVAVFEADGLQVLSPLPRRFELKPGDTEIVEVSIEVPACDTSRICLTTGCGSRYLLQDATFKADSVSVRYSPLWVPDRVPRPGLGEVQLPHDSRYRQRMMDSVREFGPITRYWVTGKDGKEYNVDSLPPDFEPMTPGWKKRHETPQAVGGFSASLGHERSGRMGIGLSGLRQSVLGAQANREKAEAAARERKRALFGQR